MPPTMTFAKKTMPKSAMLPDEGMPYKDMINGVMAGYTGHIPGARDIDATAPLGDVPQFIQPGDQLGMNGRAPRDVAWFGEGCTGDDEAPYRDEANGIMISYGGHVPRSRDCMGHASKGGVPPYIEPGRPLSQTTKTRTEAKTRKIIDDPAGVRKETRDEITYKQVMKSVNKSKAWIATFDPYMTTTQQAQNTWGEPVDPKATSQQNGLGYMVGYTGHVPGVRATVGSSFYSND